MSEATPDTAPDTAAQPDADQANEPVDSTDWKAEARKWEQRAKENKAAVAEVEKARRAAMTDTERALAEARESAAAEVRTQYGQRLAQTEFRAAAAAANPEYDVAKALKYVNLSGLLGEDGEPDSKAIASAVADLVPPVSSGSTPPPSFDGGSRQAAPSSASMSDLIRKAAGRA